MEHTVELSWETILGWFEAYCPADRSSFRGPAAEEGLRAVEQATGRSLPADQLAWWRLSDGTEEDCPVPSLIPVVWAPASVSYALSRHRMLIKDLDRHYPNLGELDNELAGTAADLPWLPSWLPIAHNLGGSHLFLDLREGPQHGCVGRMDREDISFAGEPVWSSVTEMLAKVAAALVSGTDIGGRHAVVEDGHLDWQLDPQRHTGH
ncbi:SMI1/KNR4 family protein [Actinoplanes sp. NPDC049118]|uniref:SMI1/KNR4 family protein n=1 Tax=Actinoplanes sp. NPDC049118 TaxID=3155769 RepID=UPI0033FABB26